MFVRWDQCISLKNVSETCRDSPVMGCDVRFFVLFFAHVLSWITKDRFLCFCS